MNQPEHTENKDIFCFGAFVLDAAGRELRKLEASVEIEPRAFDVMLYLARNRDRAVDKDELQDAVWPGMIVTETALTRAVMKARKAVDDDASTQAVIKTLHGHGYRFVAPLLVPEPAESPAPGDLKRSSESAHPESTVKGSVDIQPIWARPPVLIIGLVALISVLTLAWLGMRVQPTAGGDSHIAVMPVSNTTGNPEWAWSRLGLMSFVSQMLGGGSELTVVSDASIVGLVDNLNWDSDADDEANQLIVEKLRANFGASHILFMELTSDGPMFRMNYHIWGPNNRNQSGTIVGDEPTELAEGVVQGVYGILLSKSHVANDFDLVSEDPFNNEAFARGMNLSLAGRCAEAQQFFRVIIEQEPDLFAPRYEYAACLRILGEPEEAEEILKSLLEELESGGTPRSRARTLLTLGILYYRTGRIDEAMKTYQESLAIAEQFDDHVLQARVLQNLSIGYRGLSQLDEAERHLDLAVLAYQDAGRVNLPGQLYSGKANLKMAVGDFTGAEVLIQQAMGVFHDVGDRRNEAMMLNNMGYVKLQQGELDQAGKSVLQSLAIRQEIGDRVGVGRNYSFLTHIYSAKGQYKKAIQAAKSSLEIARESNDLLYVATSLTGLASAETEIGNLDAARQHYAEGRAIFEVIDDTLRTLQTDVLVARLDLRDERFDEAEELATSVLEQAREIEMVEPELDAWELIGDIELARGQLPAAVQQYSDALERVSDTSWTAMETNLERKLANAHMDLDDLDAAAPLVGSLAGKDPEIQILITRARFDFLRDNQSSAIKLMRQAKSVAGVAWTAENEELLQVYSEGDSS
jgi:tetratricopeptide (TPR) repeat protein/DNA-binding winged helix-turn-helix (wHTH) protein